MAKRRKLSDFELRLYRAESWLKCAEKYSKDDDIAFIAQWIAFNSCYLTDFKEEGIFERDNFMKFIESLVKFDKENKIENCLWTHYSAFIRTLISNQYVFTPFWNSIKQECSGWEESFEKSKNLALKALEKRNVAKIMSVVLDRLYCLRNQLIHGGASYAGRVNRSQVKDARRMLSELMPIVIEIMKNSPQDYDWGKVPYPVLEDY